MKPEAVTAKLFAQWLVEADNEIPGVPFVRFHEESGDVQAKCLAYAESWIANVKPSNWPRCILERMNRVENVQAAAKP